MKNYLTAHKSAPVLFGSLFLGLTFLVTSCAFLTWYYRLAGFMSGKWVDLLAESGVYIIHILGMILFSVLVRRKPGLILRPAALAAILAAWFLLCAGSVFATASAAVLALGLLANFLIGPLFGYYLTTLSACVPKGRRGIAFGLGGAFASIATYLLSLPVGGTFIVTKGVWIVYGILAILAFFFGAPLLCALREERASGDVQQLPGLRTADGRITEGFRFFLLMAVTILLVDMVQNMGFYFPSVDITRAGIPHELSRAFYSVGLIGAGLLHDRNRKLGFIISSTTLIFPFVSLVLLDNLAAGLTVWILAYVILGFFAVTRALLFADLAGTAPSLLFIASYGMMFGRAGEAFGIFLGVELSGSRALHITVLSVSFAVALVLLFMLFASVDASAIGAAFAGEPEKAHAQPEGAVPASDPLQTFAAGYGFSSRETEVLRRLLEGEINKEIAERMVISENTVKYHIKNIYKKTGCSSRKELTGLYHLHGKRAPSGEEKEDGTV